MRTLFDYAPGGAAAALVMLPAAKARPEDFQAHGFIDAVRSRKLRLDIALPDIRTDHYLDGDVAERLEDDVMRPLRENGYQSVWLAGISLGGMGSLQYASRREVAGVMLLAPFLGLPDANREPELLGVLARSRMPNIYLGYGKRDRYARASELLAERLPATRVTRIDGAHDWSTWSELWRIMLGQVFNA
jgi:pimeloyl-ACP methyl ester carboxylesterase